MILIDEADLDPHRIKTALGAGSVVVITPSLVAGNGWTFPETSTRRDGMGKLRVSKLRVNPHAHLASWDGRTPM